MSVTLFTGNTFAPESVKAKHSRKQYRLFKDLNIMVRLFRKKPQVMPARNRTFLGTDAVRMGT
jgi:hypothetical protein